MMRSFAETFFTRFGATTYPLDDELVVELTPDLAAVFGKPRLYLVFADGQGEARELSPAEDLLIYGSRTFDQMLALLAGRGEATQLRLPVQVEFGSDGQPTMPLPLHNCDLIENQVRREETPFYVFNFRAVYLSDEQQEEFITLGLSAEGRPHPSSVTALASFETCLIPDLPVTVEPEMLRRMLDLAAELARRQADEHAAKLEQALLPRLQKTLLRLTGFYQRLSDEVDTSDPTQAETVRADLQADLARKVADELESHRLRVTLWPLNYALVLTPLAHYRLTLATRHTQQTLTLVQNLHTGQMEDLTCRHCRQPIDQLALCDREHAVHPGCLAACCRCERDICRDCGIQPCAICGESVCIDCVAACAHCSRWLCAQHVVTCAICGQPHCTGHAFPCRWCGQTYCVQCQTDGLCQTCQAAVAGSELAVADVPAAAGVRPERYRWGRADNRAYVVYIGRSKGLDVISLVAGLPVVVADHTGQVLHSRKIRSLKLWRKFRE